ncbi:MAG: hypothetical protein GOV00_04205 [Candidatus Altiarchaeota archaeon]|nr:hypothetical protein [Candidatus Altiarchaeota archaeon]
MVEETSKMEMIGFHKGAITTLANERRELANMVATVDKLIAAHIKALQDMGVKIVGDAPKKEAKKEDGSNVSNESMENLLK